MPRHIEDDILDVDDIIEGIDSDLSNGLVDGLQGQLPRQQYSSSSPPYAPIFYSYDPITKEFCFDERIITTHFARPNLLARMVGVSEKIFGLILSAYMDGLRATIRAKNHEMITGSPPKVNIMGGQSSRRGFPNNPEAALRFAEACCDKFNEPVASLSDVEKNGNDALGLLFRSVYSIPRASLYTGKNDEDSTPSKLAELADRVIDEACRTALSEA